MRIISKHIPESFKVSEIEVEEDVEPHVSIMSGFYRGKLINFYYVFCTDERK